MINRAELAQAQLIGRDRETQAFNRALAELQKGHGQCLFVCGEPGIGKSSLMQLLEKLADAEQLPVFWGHTWEAGGAPIYWPWTQLFGRLIAGSPGRTGESLQQILPDAGNPGESAGLQPDQARFQLYAAVQTLLAGQPSPVVLILEDLHAADPDSLHLLLFLSQEIRNLPVLLAGTFREMEARTEGVSTPLWQAARYGELLRPARLDRAQAQLLAEASGRPLDDPLIDQLLTISEGNPLFLSELLSWMASETALPARLPESIHQVIREQLDRLPEETVRHLAMAAVIGRDFQIEPLAWLADCSAVDLDAVLAPALEAGILAEDPPGQMRFFHALCTETLIQQLLPAQRANLHRRYADLLQEEFAGGAAEKVSELATHLTAAGPAERAAAVAAWRQAAEQARSRSGFEEAVQSLTRALDLFGQGPQFPPAQRCRLMLELAAAELAKGDVEQGQARAKEAFVFARRVQDPALMVEAALTYGSVIVVARVDPVLIEALKECLAALPEKDVANRARVSARLASALQPAPDPMEPVQMARDAIALARTTDDPAILYEVLRSAVAAMMDFVPAEERVPLNQEFGELAAGFSDIPGQFRTTLRKIIDACELADRPMFDAAVAECERLSAQIDLPHYSWRFASILGLQATIEGRFAEAAAALAEAARLGEQAGDDSARLTVPIQKLMLLQEWSAQSEEEAEGVTAELTAVMKIFPAAEVYVQPLLMSFRDPDAIAGVLDSEPLVERIILGGDRFTLCHLGELAARFGNRSVLDRTYERLQPFADQCASLGLMGSGWHGPVAHSLAIMAVARSEPDTALACIDTALAVCRRMRAGPLEARVHQSAAGINRALGNGDAAARHQRLADTLVARFGMKPIRGIERGAAEPAAQVASDRQGPDAQPVELIREGDYWRIRHRGNEALLKHSRGLEMLSQLLASPDREIHALDLTSTGVEETIDVGTAGPVLDDQARRDYQQRIQVLRESLEDAETLGDVSGAEAAREELEFISRELAGAFGISGRSRAASSAAERARVNARRRLKDAIGKIGEQLPAAGRYLESTIKTGTYCKYQPL